MTPTPRIIETARITWRGLNIEIRYEARWLGGDFTAHLEVETIEPAKAPLPITETGYRAHFANAEEFEAAGGPVPYVLAWLDHAAKSKAWIEAEIAARQGSLF